ncbi:Pyrrolo-quinoline quinone redox coenzyme [gamma proteobacterium HdN1]|nr:Pyrrolo-quinoline quinone redox coenzyme [gamma proteobacterium HdN1]
MSLSLRVPLPKVALSACLLAMVATLSACSDDDVAPPSPLPDFDSTLVLKKMWSASVGDGVGDYYISLSPSVTDTSVFAGSVDGTVARFERRKGAEMWEKETDYAITGGVAAGHGVVAFGTSSGDVVALREEDGSQLWKVNLGGQILSTPALAEDRVVVQTVDGRLHGLALADGSRQWLYDTSIPILTLRGESNPLLVGNVVLAGFANGKLVALQADNGFVGWERQVAEPDGRSELERLVDIDGRMDIEGANVYAATYQGRVAAVEVPSGRQVWSKPFSSHSGLSVVDGLVFISSDDGDVVALDSATGAEQWRQTGLKRRSVTAPVAYEDFVVVGDFEGYLFWLDRRTGEFLARVRVDSDGLRAPAVVVKNVVYVQANDGTLAAYRVKKRISK